ncbi:MAG TPA: tripartite tricarboxylate transporter substrate binding protein [Xanthobacteraceae bacterium]|nr:tripartite tricarboxylate transporter substrate binding protein [Xanthobacteraceae bacterium]
MKRLSLMLLSACLAFGVATAAAQDKYPSRPIKVLVPYAPGGATDITARLVGDEFQKITGQGFVVLNKPGANGLLAIDELAKSTPDGYTLMIGNVSTNAITPILYKSKMSSDYLKSVTAVTNLIDVPAFVAATTVNFPVKTIPELIDYAKKNPGKISYGTVGPGSYPHYDMAYLAKKAGDLDMAALPNKNGASGVIQDLLRGDIQVAFLNVASSTAHVQAGKFTPLAVVSNGRLPDYPNVPTMKDVGFPDVGTIAWNAMFAPAGTPKPVLAALHAAVLKALASPELKEKFKKQSMVPAPQKSVEEAQKWLASEMKHWETITTEVKIDIAQ